MFVVGNPSIKLDGRKLPVILSAHNGYAVGETSNSKFDSTRHGTAQSQSSARIQSEVEKNVRFMVGG